VKRLFWLLVLFALTVWAEEAPTAPETLNARLETAFQLLEKGNYSKAIELFEDVVALDWRNFDAHFGLGLAYLRSQKFKEALFEFKQLAKLYPDRFEVWYNLGVVQVKLLDLLEAARSFERALQVGERQKLPAEVLRPAYLALAEVYRKLDAPDKAAAVLKRAYRAMPGDPEIAVLLADALVASGRTEDAIPYLYEVLSRDRGNVAASLLLADALVDLGLHERALRELDRSLAAARTSKDRARLLYKKALVLAEAGAKREEVERLLKEAVTLDPELWQAYYDIGRIRLALGDAEGALRAFLRAYRENPNDPRVLLGLAAAYDALGDGQNAYRMAKLALARAKGADRLEALFLLGKSAYRIGRYEEAVEALKKVASERKSDAEVWYWLGLAYYAMEDYGKAVTALSRAAQLDNRVEVLEALGAAYLAAGRYGEAEQVFMQVIEKDPKRAEAWYYLGWALKALGRDAEAKRAWKKAYALGYRPEQGVVGRP